MSPTNLRELLTAAVDGELTPAERKAARRILRESEAARVLYAQLKADAARLKALPRIPAPTEVAENVLGVIQDRALTPTPLPPSRRSAPRFNWSMLPVWVNVATAAAVLVVISIGSYMYFAASQDYMARQKQEMAAKLPQDSDIVAADQGSKPGIADRSADSREPPLEVDPPRDVVAQGSKTREPELGPIPRLVKDDKLFTPLPDSVPEIEPFDIDKIRVSQMFSLHELAADEALRAKLAREMKKDELIRLDLFCETTPKALDLVLAALKSRGVVTVTDAFVNDRVKRKVPTEVMIFTEALSPDEVAQLMSVLGAQDRKSEEHEFSTLVAAPFLPADLTRLGQILGVPNVLPKVPKGNPAVDIRKPLPEGTASHVAATLAKMGTGGSKSPRPEKVGVVVAYSPRNPHPGASREIKQFLDRRGERRPDAKPLMLVLRTIK